MLKALFVKGEMHAAFDVTRVFIHAETNRDRRSYVGEFDQPCQTASAAFVNTPFN